MDDTYDMLCKTTNAASRAFDTWPLASQAEPEEVDCLKLSESLDCIDETEIMQSTVKDYLCLTSRDISKSGSTNNGSGGIEA